MARHINTKSVMNYQFKFPKFTSMRNYLFGIFILKLFQLWLLLTINYNLFVYIRIGKKIDYINDGKNLLIKKRSLSFDNCKAIYKYKKFDSKTYCFTWTLG